MKQNTIDQLNQFKLNDKINVYSLITGEFNYSGSIVSIQKKAWLKDNQPSRFAVIIDSNGNKRENFLASAKTI